ncbi:hypothetical protein [Paracoccus sp. S1E-3]|uniref:hypothetical protein n=1 Tax=Paracoccus sp. S1E-3 TaxID=2756130 RepID=UPI0015EF2CBF|nr:hypothetical protein [Paracoccus sp. S1E-3]MBA4490730.1 hypothetical protein [Paracoccus sp. S1E-3]
MRSLIFLLLALWPLATAAHGCDGRAAEIVRAAWPGAQPDDAQVVIEGRRISLSGSGPYGIFCRRWPAHPELLLVGVPMTRPEGTAPGDDRLGDLELLVLEADSLAPRARLRLADFIRDGAISLASLRVDTTPYRLFDDRLAFGIRRDLAAGSRRSPFRQADLTLFDLQGDQLRPVLSGLVVMQTFGDWDLDCAGRFETMTRAIDTVPGREAADIVLRGTVRRRTDRIVGGACVRAETTETLATITLRHDGRIYPLPANPPPAAR